MDSTDNKEECNGPVSVDEVMSVKIFGTQNPAIAARWFLESIRLSVDKESFNVAAEICGDVINEPFFVKSRSDLRRLCELGNFAIVLDNGVIVARPCHKEGKF